MGDFFIEFQNAKLPVVVLRRLLSHLALKKRASANAAEAKRWNASDILFISAFGGNNDREMAFAHFHKDPDTTELPILRVLGWDGTDTPLKLDHIARVLKDRLHWPQNPTDQKAWRKQWAGAFRHRPGHIINTSNDLAEQLAGFARRIRDAAITIMAHESEVKGHLLKLHRGFQTALIGDLTENDFADTYAQTITYGLLTAALTTDDITSMVPVTNPFIKEMLQSFLQAGGRKGGMDFDELGINEVVELLLGDETDLPAILRDFGNRKPGEDPVMHFYEHFLSAYNKKLKIQRGVFYTPQPVVSYIVRSVHELLQTEFGLADGLADTTTWGEMLQKHPDLKLPNLSDDPAHPKPLPESEPFVQILDPATGTATFLVEVIDLIHRHLLAKWKTHRAGLPSLATFLPLPSTFVEYWNRYVPSCLLPRLHAFELMMAPYAIAHMKIGLKLAETGYKFATEERARIYLTNALEAPDDNQAKPVGFEALAHEAKAVNKIKRNKRFTVVIGNPPYSGLSANMSEHAQKSVDAYKIVDGGALHERKLWLQDDYVKFIRNAQTTIENSCIGVLGYVTNHGYLDNPTFRGMRQSLMGTFPFLCVLDLHGNSNKKEKSPDGKDDKSVFDIKQGVAICLAARGIAKSAVGYSELWGSREVKNDWLNYHSLKTSSFFQLTPDSPYYAFIRQDSGRQNEYAKWLSLWDSFTIYGTGIVTGRDALTIDFEKQPLLDRLNLFASLGEEDARVKFGLGPDARDWKVATAQRDLRANPPSPDRLIQIQYRPFDKRWTYYTGSPRGLFASPCRSAMTPMLSERNIGLISARSNASSGNDHFFVTRNISEAKCGESSRQSALFPLYPASQAKTGAGELVFGSHPPPNFTDTLQKQICQTLSSSEGLTPEDIFCYIYAVFHCPGYRSRYAEFLKIDFPRLPLTANLELFRTLVRLGVELTALHLLESPKLDQPITEFIGGPNPEVEKPTWSDDTVWVDKKQTTGFQGVPEAVWNFHIGGYQVCHKWLKDRKGRTLSAEDIAHYHKIVVSLTETIRLMAEIDEIIETHGGWPGAFAASTSS